MSEPEYANVRIFDTTLRDGEQSPGATLTQPEKLEIARQLEVLGVDIIEAGFPVSSNGDFESVHAIAAEITRSVVCGLARCHPKDIERAGNAVKDAKMGRIHVFCATSKIHREHKLRKGKEDIIKLAVDSINAAREYTQDIEFSPEDASRTELEFLEEIVHAAIEAGATTINMPDTVGYATPKSYGEIFAHIRKKLNTDARGVVLSAHCHDDLGMAVANSLSAVEGGARQVECTINGIGERAGNAALEEIVMALRTRHDFYKADTRIDATRIYPTSRMVAGLTGLSVQRNKAIVGENAFAHESGIHQDGVLKFRETYEIMDPTSVGIPKNSLVLGKHSGRHAFRDRVGQLGYTLTDEQL
jgi:2-isopropylmalate synthase